MRRALRLIAGLGLAALALAPAPARACDDDGLFYLDAVWPADGATGVPRDGVLVLRGQTVSIDGPTVTVERDGLPVDGTTSAWAQGVFVWRAAAPLEAGAAYHVTIADSSGTVALDFTTGSDLAPSPVAPTLTDLALEQYRLELQECAVVAGCSCEKWTTVGHEDRMRLSATLPAPPAPFGDFTLVALEIAAGPDLFPANMVHVQPWSDPPALDFGVAGTWPSDQVCIRAAALDPLGGRADGPVACLDIGDVNTPPPPDEATGGCATTQPGLAPLALLVLASLSRRRRRPRARHGAPAR